MASKTKPKPERGQRLSLPVTDDQKTRLEALSEAIGQGVSATNVALLAMAEALPMLESRHLGKRLPDVYRLGLDELIANPPSPVLVPGVAPPAEAPNVAEIEPPAPVAPEVEPEPTQANVAQMALGSDDHPETQYDEAPGTDEEHASAWVEDGPLLPPEPEPDAPVDPIPEAQQDALKDRLAVLLEQGVPMEDAYEMARRQTTSNVTQLFETEDSPDDVDPFKCTHGVRFDAPDACGDCAAQGF